jgi:hypothetical protein
MCGDFISSLFGKTQKRRKALAAPELDKGETTESLRQEQLLTEQRLEQREIELRQRSTALIGGMRSLVSGSAGGAGFTRALTRSKSDNA